MIYTEQEIDELTEYIDTKKLKYVIEVQELKNSVLITLNNSIVGSIYSDFMRESMSIIEQFKTMLMEVWLDQIYMLELQIEGINK